MNSPDFGSDIAAFHKVPGWAGGAAQVDAAAMSPSCRDRHTPDPGNTFSWRSSRRSGPGTQEGKREMFFMASRSMMSMDAGCRSGTCKTDHPGREVFTARRRHVSMVRSLSRPESPDKTCFHQQFSRFSAGRGSRSSWHLLTRCGDNEADIHACSCSTYCAGASGRGGRTPPG